jgi:uncharacterized protein with PIN domain
VPVKFLVDENVGRLAKWLRMVGYDATFIKNVSDTQLVEVALSEERILLTRDTQILQRRVVSSHQLHAILIQSDQTGEQLRQVIKELHLELSSQQFTRCMECNAVLASRTREEVKDLVPPYVFKTQEQYMLCPHCQRIYWRGTHWQAMKKRINDLAPKG